MRSFSEVKAILDETFPDSKGPYQDAVAERLSLYFAFLADRGDLFSGKIIDVAGQYGNFLSVAERFFPGLTEMALTRYPVRGEEKLTLRSKPVPVIPFHCERDRLAVRDGAYDVAVFTEVLEHLLYDPVWTVMEINRVLREGGKLFLATPNAGSLKWIVSILKGRNPAGSIEYKPRRPFERHNRIYTSREVIDLLQGLGFKIIEFSTGPTRKILALSRILALAGLATKDFPQHSGYMTLIIAEKTSHFSVDRNYPQEIRWPPWLYSKRPELCVRPSNFIESEDDEFPLSESESAIDE